MNLKENIMIFSVYNRRNSEPINLEEHQHVMRELMSNGVLNLELNGVYNGTKEKSILIVGFQHRDLVEKYCKLYSQECYLESHNDRTTFLVFPNGSRENVGVLTSVTKDEAMKHGSYSYNESTEQYFVTRKDII